MTGLESLLGALDDAGVEFVIVGGVAATIHGSSRLTSDLDVLYARAPENLKRLVQALEPLRPYLRGAPEGLPFRLDESTLRAGLNFTLTTTAGALDLLGEIAGIGTFDESVGQSVEVTAAPTGAGVRGWLQRAVVAWVASVYLRVAGITGRY